MVHLPTGVARATVIQMKVETNQGQPTDQLRVQQREGSSRLPNETPNETPNDQGPATPPGRSPLLVVFLTVFVDLVGFGIIIPLSPFLAREFAATPTEIGFLMAIYSIMQFAFSPFWGGLSDRVGRRPVILLSLFGSTAISYCLRLPPRVLTSATPGVPNN